MSSGFKSEDIDSKRADYLIQYRNGLWVAIREKEGNVWKFVTFYVTAISLIIGLGQKLATSLDFTIDVSMAAAIVGLLTFWGLAIVIDSNSWMARNLKLIGNIEKLFIPINEFDRFIPRDYSSPLFRYFRPYTVKFFFLTILGMIAYLNFILHFPEAPETWRGYLLPAMTIIYILGFHSIQNLDDATRGEYFRFYGHAPGATLSDDKGRAVFIGSEQLPIEYLEFKVALSAKFTHWAFLGASVVLISFAVREKVISQRSLVWVILFVGGLNIVYWALSHFLYIKLKGIEPKKNSAANWEVLGATPLTQRVPVKTVKKFYLFFVKTCRWIVLVAGIVVACWPYRNILSTMFFQ